MGVRYVKSVTSLFKNRAIRGRLYGLAQNVQPGLEFSNPVPIQSNPFPVTGIPNQNLTESNSDTMKKLISLLSGVLLLPMLIHAQEVSYSLSGGYESKYVFRGAFLSNDSIQGAFDVAVDDFYFGAWTALPLTDEMDFGNEIDFYAGYGAAIDEVWSFDFGGTYYYYPDAADASTFEAYAGIAGDLAFGPALYIYYDFDLETFTIEGSLGSSWDVADKTTFDIGGSLGWFEPDSGDSGYYIMTSAGFSYAFTDDASGSIGIRWSDLEDADSEFWVGASVSSSW